MNKLHPIHAFSFIFLLFILGSCAAVGAVFKTGLGVGIFIAIVVVMIIIIGILVAGRKK